MTKAQRTAIERLKKRHHAPVLERGFDVVDPNAVRVRILDPKLPEDERDRVITATGIVQEPLA